MWLIAYSASGAFPVVREDFVLSSPRDPGCQEGRQGVNGVHGEGGGEGRGGVTRAVGLWKEPVLPHGGFSGYRFAGVYWFRFRHGEHARPCAMLGAGRRAGRRRTTLKRGECDYKGGDAVTSSYSRVRQEKAGRGNPLRRTHVCNYTAVVPVSSSPSPARVPPVRRPSDETCIPRVFRSVHFREEVCTGGRAQRDKTNLGGVRSLPILSHLLSVFFVFPRIRANDDDDDDDDGDDDGGGGGGGANRYQWDRQQSAENSRRGGKLTRD